MDSAKEIAKDMLDAINVDGSGFIGAVVKGIISFPVSLGYLGYDVIDTGHRRDNQNDKFRLANLIKKTKFNKETIEAVIKPFIDEFISHVDMGKLSFFAKDITGTVAGKLIFSQVTGFNLGRAIASRGAASFISGAATGGVLAIGAEASRAIYTSRYLRERNPAMYEALKLKGDLDLLYFLVEDIVRPFETACSINQLNPEKFGSICEYFFGGL
nr:hypothetical protein [uncultured Enterobacter sp.]